MDFSLEYSKEQEEFAYQVRAWADSNIPQDYTFPADPAKLSYEQYQMQREVGRKLGEKGWLVPMFPKEYGGGGLSLDMDVIDPAYAPGGGDFQSKPPASRHSSLLYGRS